MTQIIESLLKSSGWYEEILKIILLNMEKVAIHMKKQKENFIKYINILKKGRATNTLFDLDQILRMKGQKIVRRI